MICIETKRVKKISCSAAGGGPALPEGEDFPPLNGIKFLARLSANRFLVLF
jgi:hypothetical protein